MALRGDRRFLVEAAYAPATVKKYSEALTDYFHDLYESGFSKDDARCTLYGILMLQPRLRDALPLAVLALRGWERTKIRQYTR